jgi:hypothetical protein
VLHALKPVAGLLADIVLESAKPIFDNRCETLLHLLAGLVFLLEAFLDLCFEGLEFLEPCLVLILLGELIFFDILGVFIDPLSEYIEFLSVRLVPVDYLVVNLIYLLIDILKFHKLFLFDIQLQLNSIY